MIEVPEQAVLYYRFIFYHGDEFAFEHTPSRTSIFYSLMFYNIIATR